jgi:hypothetical protein
MFLFSNKSFIKVNRKIKYRNTKYLLVLLKSITIWSYVDLCIGRVTAVEFRKYKTKKYDYLVFIFMHYEVDTYFLVEFLCISIFLVVLNI